MLKAKSISINALENKDTKWIIAEGVLDSTVDRIASKLLDKMGLIGKKCSKIKDSLVKEARERNPKLRAGWSVRLERSSSFSLLDLQYPARESNHEEIISCVLNYNSKWR